MIQEDLVDTERKLNETTARQGLYGRKRPMPTVIQIVKQLEGEQRRLEAELPRKTRDDVDKLKLPFSKCITFFFFQKDSLQSSNNPAVGAETPNCCRKRLRHLVSHNISPKVVHRS